MTPEQIRIAMAEIAGIKFDPEDQPWWEIPNYPEDLNAVHEVEKKLYHRDFYSYVDTLKDICSPDGLYEGHIGHEVHATALQRCEAILRTLRKWKE